MLRERQHPHATNGHRSGTGKLIPLGTGEGKAAHRQQPALRTQLGSIHVETVGGPMDQSAEDLRELHEDMIVNALERSGDVDNRPLDNWGTQ